MKMTKEYLRMSDVFVGDVESCQISGWKHQVKYVPLKTIQQYAAHAINSHDELVEEIQWLRGELSAAEKVLEGVELVIAERIKNGSCDLDDIADAVSQAMDRINGYVD